MRASIVPVLGLVGAFTTSASGQVVELSAHLDGLQEVPIVDTMATGEGTLTLDMTSLELSWDITFDGLSSPETAAHLHGAAWICASAPPVITLASGSPKVGTATLTPEQMADLLAGLWYVNVHSEMYAPGELRGQIQPVGIADPLPGDLAVSDYHIELEPLADGLVAPNWGVAAPGRPGELIVTDQPGRVWAIDLATRERRLFLDASPLIIDLGIFGEGSFDERGLLGIAFHPDFATNGRLYTYTSEPVFKAADFSTLPPGGIANHRSVLREWRVNDPSAQDAVVDPTTARTIIRIDQPQFNHDAGAIAFGPDGMLYVALGDGGGGDDQDGPVSLGAPMIGHGCIGNGQDATNVLGSILRIDVEGNDSANGAYGIPTDNPFVDPDDPRVDEIYAYGLRNPFRVSFDMETGDFWIPDVGQNAIEEINLGVSGANYGWNRKEGTFFFLPRGGDRGQVVARPLDLDVPVVDPIAQYDHDEGTAIIGGFVYRGEKIAPLVGKYVFGEFARTFSNDGRLFHLDETNTIREFNLVGLNGLGLSLLGFGQDAAGELYVLANATGTPFEETGVVLRMRTRAGDFDASGVVDVADLLALLAAWGPCDGCAQDIDGDDMVGVSDLILLLGGWG